MTRDTPVGALVRRARRRHALHLLTDQSAFALCFVLAGAVVLLIIGTQILDWYWLAALAVAGIAIGAYRVRRNLLSEYRIAQTLDRNLELNDALSTALFFADQPERTKSPNEVIEKQRDLAATVARTVDLHRGIPYHVSRPVQIGLVLALVTAGVFGLRYGVSRQLDLRASLVQIAFDSFAGSNTQIADAKHGKQPPARAKDWSNPSTLKYDPWQANTMDQKGAPDSVLNTIDTPNVDNSNNTGASADTKANGTPSKNEADSKADNPENSDASNGTPDQSPDGSQGSPKDGNKAGAPPQAGQPQKNGNSGDSSSLTDKMRDALANLLSKLKINPNGNNSKTGQQQQNQNGSQQSAQNRQGKDQSGTPQPGKSQQDAMASPDGQSSQDAQGNEQAKNGQGKSNGKSDDRSNSQDGKSGIGRQDGDKSIKEAEQVAAMGKISEIIGKRAQNVSGEVMVEVASGNQQLRTQYSQRKAAHSDAGGEINRDEVPLAYQQYVQQYFEEIRKMPAAARAKGGAKTPDVQKKTGPS